MYVTNITELRTTNGCENVTDLNTTNGCNSIRNNIRDKRSNSENNFDKIIPSISLTIPCGVSI